MDLAALQTALAIRRHGSIAAAARALELDPSSVSRTLAGVEAEVGIRLFQRTTRRLVVTEEGQSYLNRVAPLVEELDAAREAARGARTQPIGLLRMTTSVAFSGCVIEPLMDAFQNAYPEVTVELHSSDANLDLLEQGIDLAVRLAPAPKGDLVSTRLMGPRYRAVASPDYLLAHGTPDDPRALGVLNCLRFALPGLRDQWQFREADGTQFEVAVSGRLILSNAMGLREAARRGQGIALLADWLVGEDIEAGRLIDLFPAHDCALSEFDTAVWALYPNRAYLPRKVRVMIDFLKSNLPVRSE